MGQALLEFLVLGRVPGTDFYIGYKTTLVVAGILLMIVLTSPVINSRRKLSKLINKYPVSKLIEQITI